MLLCIEQIDGHRHRPSVLRTDMAVIGPIHRSKWNVSAKRVLALTRSAELVWVAEPTARNTTVRACGRTFDVTAIRAKANTADLTQWRKPRAETVFFFEPTSRKFGRIRIVIIRNKPITGSRSSAGSHGAGQRRGGGFVGEIQEFHRPLCETGRFADFK
jgi:hypothetical protein